MRFTAKSEYGLLALIDLASRWGTGPISAREIAERQSIPPKFLEQLFVSLRKAGLVTAMRGARGGFVLERSPSEINVLEIVEALEGPLKPTTCEGGSLCSKSQVCAAATVWNRATAALRDVFETTTLADIAGEQAAMDAHSVGASQG